jgi:hypothetical protein
MDKRLFNKIIKKQMLLWGFEKTGSSEYAKDCKDGMTKIVIRTPEYVGFTVGAQFADYGPYTGKIAGTRVLFCTAHSLLLRSVAINEYSEEEIATAVKAVMEEIALYLEGGKEAIVANLDQWQLDDPNERVQNENYVYFGKPAIDPYSESYMLDKISDIKRGGFISVGDEEYQAHKEYYDGYANHGCALEVDSKDDSVMIRYVGESAI